MADEWESDTEDDLRFGDPDETESDYRCDAVTILCSLERESTELSSCELRKSGRNILAATIFEPRLRTCLCYLLPVSLGTFH
jgi:hypothetical protein